nr:hypothetical protein JVH1_3018 [Rhodococcus sp. JVH1]
MSIPFVDSGIRTGRCRRATTAVIGGMRDPCRTVVRAGAEERGRARSAEGEELGVSSRAGNPVDAHDQ